MVPISFVGEHIETLQEIDIEYKEIAEKAGIKNFRRVRALNTHPTFINGLSDLVISCLDGPIVNIEEASQFVLADLISLGGIAKNIVLVGDQQQLGQPTQGSHPNLSGNSVLEYLLKGKDTVPADMGIFLTRTYRMHTNINSFISENFYENKLLTNPQNQNRKIDFPKNFFINNLNEF